MSDSLPEANAILAFVREAGGEVHLKALVRAFGAHRPALRAQLVAMCAGGLLEEGAGQAFRLPGALPKVVVLSVVAAGRLVRAVPEKWQGVGAPPMVQLAESRLRLTEGDRILVRITGRDGRSGGRYEGTLIRRIGHRHAKMLGVVVAEEGQLYLKPTDRRLHRRWPLHQAAVKAGVAAGELVFAEITGSGARMAAHVVERLGKPAEGAHLSDIAIAEKGIPAVFPEAAITEAEAAAARWTGAEEEGRADWTAVPFVTIDPPDARDFDDAVFAEPEGEGWRLCVAIADVASFVRPGGALDREAFERGNSVYFPDQVVPMLPDVLSGGVCSLKAGVPRAALVAEIGLSGAGEIRSFRFHRGKIRVIANLSYEKAQQLADQKEDLPQAVLAPLWGCWRALEAAREARAPLELEIPEKKVLLDAEGHVKDVVERPRLQAHRVIEDMMIVANVAAARTLEEKRAPVLYRCHEPPEREKLLALRDYLATLGIKFTLGQVMLPATFNQMLARAKGRADLPEIAEAVLRSQTQAYYAPRATGHFGLALASYAHFTSPIRRYADLVIHRALIRACRLGEGGLEENGGRFAAIGEHVSLTERRAMEAERLTLERYIARHLAEAVGEELEARITGVREFGFFARIESLGGDGFVPVSALGAERFRYDAEGRFLEGVESGTRFPIGMRLALRLEDADVVTGGLRFSLPGVEPVARFRNGRRPAGRPAGFPRSPGRHPAARRPRRG